MDEIERKYLINDMPDISDADYADIVQGYLNTGNEPSLRVRKYNDDYFLTYKFTTDEQKEKSYKMCTEYELPISKEAYEHLLKKADGKIIEKRRYLLPYKDLIIELDIFRNWLSGLIIAEVEFEDEAAALDFEAPNWFGEEVTKKKMYRNSYLSSGKFSKKDLLK